MLSENTQTVDVVFITVNTTLALLII